MNPWNTAKNISWNKNSLTSMLKAQNELFNMIKIRDFNMSDEMKKIYINLQNDIINHYTSVCSVCGDQQSIYSNMNIEHAQMKVSWGYESNHDCETHKLILCDKCYDEYILNGPLGKFVKIDRYM